MKTLCCTGVFYKRNIEGISLQVITPAKAAKVDYIYCMDNDRPKRSLLFYISPCAIAAVIVLIGIIDSYRQLDASQGWSGIGLIIGIPALLMLIVVDVVVKLAITKKAHIVWLIEAIVVLAGIIYMVYFSSFGF